MSSSKQKRRLIKGLLWVTPVVAVVRIPSHAQTTLAANPAPPFPDFSQRLLTCATTSHQIYYEVEVCNIGGPHPIAFRSLSKNMLHATDTPEITINQPSFPFELASGSCTIIRFGAYHKTLEFTCSEIPLHLLVLKQDPAQAGIFQLDMTLDPQSYGSSSGGSAGPDTSGTATSTLPQTPDVSPDIPPPPPHRPPPITDGGDGSGTGTSTATSTRA